eukprot:2342786-Alexandrium_andersonii.AAC.1
MPPTLSCTSRINIRAPSRPAELPVLHAVRPRAGQGATAADEVQLLARLGVVAPQVARYPADGRSLDLGSQLLVLGLALLSRLRRVPRVRVEL